MLKLNHAGEVTLDLTGTVPTMAGLHREMADIARDLRRRDLAGFHAEADALTVALDKALTEAVAAGWKPNTFRIVPKDGGFQLEESVVTAKGPAWKKVMWGSNRAAA